MTVAKDLKRIVRSRMQKTGESYTTARLHVVKKTEASKPDYEALAGMKNPSLQKATGRTWVDWVELLDKAGAAKMDHPSIAKHVSSLGTPSWWSQMVTVGYERIRGLRARGQQRGTRLWQTTKSRTFGVPVRELFAAFQSAAKRRRWLDTKVTVKSSTEPKTMRLAWPDGTSVVLGFYAKGAAKSSVAIQHEKIPTKAEADRLKAYWGERLDALKEVLGG